MGFREIDSSFLQGILSTLFHRWRLPVRNPWLGIWNAVHVCFMWQKIVWFWCSFISHEERTT